MKRHQSRGSNRRRRFGLLSPSAVALSLLLRRLPPAGGFHVDPRRTPSPARFGFGGGDGCGGPASRPRVLVPVRTLAPLRDKGGGSDRDGDETPFFARTAERFAVPKDSDAAGDAASAADGVADPESPEGRAAVAVVVEKPAESSPRPEEEKSAAEIARELKAQAERARLEAERMDAMLTLEKIAALERRLENKSALEKRPEEEESIRKQLAALRDKLKGPGEESNPVAKKAAAVEAVKPSAPGSASKSPPPSIGDGDESDLPEELRGMNITEMKEVDMYDLVPPIPEDELRTRSEAFRRTPKVLQEITAKAAGFDDATNASAVVEQMYKDEKVMELKKQLRDSGRSEPLDEAQLDDALEGYMKLPLPIQDLIARSVGMDDGRNATAVIRKLEAEGKLFSSGDSVSGFEVDTEFITDADMSKLFEVEEGAARDRFIESMLPKVTRKEGQVPTEEDVDEFFRTALGRETFNPTEKPVKVPGGYVIYGENRKKSGKDLVTALEKKLEGTDVCERLRFFYVLDPSPLSREELDDLEPREEKPEVILVTGGDLTPETNGFVKPLVSSLGLFTAASFSLGTLSLNQKALDLFYAQADAGIVDLGWIETMAGPIFAGIVISQLAHEAAHQLAAFKGKFKAGLPTLIPSLQLGLSGSITPLLTPPPDVKSLFDFAISGPLTGMAVSFALLLTGLFATLNSDPAALAQFPALPVSLIRSSSLVAGAVQGVLGDGILLTPDPAADTILLHPLAVAGLAGMVTNALNLLPLGNTDGGRVCQTLFGRSWSRIITTFTSISMILAGLFGLDDAGVLLWFSFYASIWQRETEIPCMNEVDDLDVVRGMVSIGAFVLVMLTLIPVS